MRRQIAIALTLVPIQLARAATAVAQAPQRFTVTESRLEIYDAAGSVTLRRGTGSDIVIAATRAGADGGGLTFGLDHAGSRAVFRVVFPVDRIDRIAAPPGQQDSRNQLRLRADGTFGGDRDGGFSGGRRGSEIEIGGASGFRGWGDLEITVPAGREVRVHLAAGRAALSGVSGDYTLDLWGADVQATNIEGHFLFDTGSGDVTINGAKGSLRLDTGSGRCSVEHVTGDLLDVDTGSGNAVATDVAVDRSRFDTGSGDVTLRSFRSRNTLIDTGSGAADIEFGETPIDELSIDTGSGGVRLTLPRVLDARLTAEPGSGGVDVVRAGAIFERRDENHLVVRFGEGRGRIKIDSGSGGITIR